MAIKVKGETYANRQELDSTILDLEAQLEELPSDTPEHESLAKHIKDLRTASDDADDDAEVAPPEVVPAPDELPAPDDDGGATEETTHDIRTAFETGAAIVCPTCGQEVDFPEAPPMNPHAKQCDECMGWGKVVNPTRVDGHIWKECGKCRGIGYTTDEPAYSPASFSAAAPTPQLAGAVWDASAERWAPPTGATDPPWSGAQWDGLLGKWA